MRIRTAFLTLLVVGALATCFSTPALAATRCGSSHSSSSSTYGGQGNQITGIACDGDGPSTPPSTPSASSTLPFTGLDIGLLVAAGMVLVASGLVLRWRLRHGGQ